MPGETIQTVRSATGAVATGTTQISQADTIPTNTAGDQYMSISITPRSATNVLVVEAQAALTVSASANCAMALFQDATANALAAITNFVNTGGAIITNPIKHRLLAATTSATTFKVRAGPELAATITFNGRSGGRIFGGVMNSWMEATELMG